MKETTVFDVVKEASLDAKAKKQAIEDMKKENLNVKLIRNEQNV